jgi:cation diffusion facilitator CzcD-associated flavoprotein CzcO
MSQDYDFIIVGGGTAGLVLATRLSENTNVQVLVIEAGEDLTEDARVNVPGMWSSLTDAATNWSFKTVPQVSQILLCSKFLPRGITKYTYPKWCDAFTGTLFLIHCEGRNWGQAAALPTRPPTWRLECTEWAGVQRSYRGYYRSMA